MDAGARKRALKRLRSSLSAAKFWTAVAGGSTAGAAFFIPYEGMSAGDGVWVVVAGLSATMALMRWTDYRRTARAMPALRDSLALHGDAALRDEARGFVTEAAAAIRRGRMRSHFRQSAAWGPYQRLERASLAAEQLAQRLEGNPEAMGALSSAAGTGPALVDLAMTVRDVEQSIKVAPADRRERMRADRDRMVQRLVAGVEAYEEMVSAAGECLAASDGLREALTASGSEDTLGRLTDAADRLRGAAAAAGEVGESLRPKNGEIS